MTKLDLRESRYARQELITWWDQQELSQANVLVVGAGALGNEIVKSLALLGVGRIHVVDMDRIEHSNLARGVFFRADHEGELKAEVVADAANQLNPEIDVSWSSRSILEWGIGALVDFDLVIAGLDNREARAWVNQACRKLGKPWVDGAIEGLRGVARVFLAAGPCYECTLGAVDREILAQRRSCALLTAEEVLQGKVPTTATSASVIAGIQVQEAIKLLQGREEMLALRNQAFFFLGETLETYLMGYSEDEFCPAHDLYGELREIRLQPTETLSSVFSAAEGFLSEGLVADFESEVVLEARCVACSYKTEVNRLVRSLDRQDVECSKCHEVMQLDIATSFERDSKLAEVPLILLGLPKSDVISVRDQSGDRVHFVVEVF